MQTQRDASVCFVDCEKGFDKVRLNELINILKQIGVDGKNLGLIMNINDMERVALKLDGELTDWIDVKRGVGQGYVISPDLFNICADFVIRNVDDEGIGGRNWW